MPTSRSLSPRAIVSLLERSRAHFKVLGCIPLDYAAQLMQHGVDVPRLEARWEKLNG